jgi:hypothetical protein
LCPIFMPFRDMRRFKIHLINLDHESYNHLGSHAITI